MDDSVDFIFLHIWISFILKFCCLIYEKNDQSIYENVNGTQVLTTFIYADMH